ncbi:MAG: endonuclease/exonuclease/phosphatase family protein, partial [Polyangiaceae bacterium]
MSRARAVLVIALVATLLSGCRNAGDPAPASTASPPSDQPTPSEPSAQRGPAPPSSSVTSSSTLRIVTYNILASPIFAALRRDAIVALLDDLDADIVALQEVPSWMVDALTNPASQLARYRHTERDGAPFVPGGQLVLARHPITRTAAAVLPGRQRRTVLVATVEVAGHAITVATSHMESFLDDGPTRSEQLDVVFEMLAPAEHGVFLGDFNFGDGEQPETGRLAPRYVDVWRVLHPGDPGFTWNNDQNPMAGIGAFAGEP